MAAAETGLPLYSERLVLRNFQDGDLGALLGYHNDPEVAKFQGFTALTEEQGRRFIERQRDRRLGEPGEWTQVALERRDTGEMIGDLGFRVNGDLPHEAEIGYRLARRHQRQGFAAEAVSRLLDHAFTVLRLHRVIAYTACENRASIALLERVGFRREGHLKKSWNDGEGWIDEYLYAVLEEEWSSA